MKLLVFLSLLLLIGIIYLILYNYDYSSLYGPSHGVTFGGNEIGYSDWFLILLSAVFVIIGVPILVYKKLKKGTSNSYNI